MSDTASDTDLLSARLAAVERALTDRACDCAHEAFSRPERTETDPTGGATDDPVPHPDPALEDAVRALCEYVIAHERAVDPTDQHTAAVREALDSLGAPDEGTPLEPPATAETADAGSPSPVSLREWLARVASTALE